MRVGGLDGARSPNCLGPCPPLLRVVKKGSESGDAKALVFNGLVRWLKWSAAYSLWTTALMVIGIFDHPHGFSLPASSRFAAATDCCILVSYYTDLCIKLQKAYREDVEV